MKYSLQFGNEKQLQIRSYRSAYAKTYLIHIFQFQMLLTVDFISLIVVQLMNQHLSCRWKVRGSSIPKARMFYFQSLGPDRIPEVSRLLSQDCLSLFDRAQHELVPVEQGHVTVLRTGPSQ